MSLTEEEKKQLAYLLKKIDSKEIRGDVWHAIVNKFVTVPIELCILDDKDRILLIYRKDEEFDGYHMPGSVINYWETFDEAKNRLIKTEVIDGAGIDIEEPEPIGWLDSPAGYGSSRHGVLLLHIARLKGDFKEKEGYGFFDFDNLPKNTLDCHLWLIPFFKRYINDKKIILGK